VGCDSCSGVSFPDTAKLASAYGLPTATIDEYQTMKEVITTALSTKGPFVCDVRLSPDYKFEPKLSSERRPDGSMISKPLEDMYPFLDRDEFRSNMIAPEWDPEK
jgi:acetolactate synthase-1/2/3 large subunit